MKAWLVRKRDEFYATVVFAETRAKAKIAALSTGCCEYANYIDIEARREPQLDKYYKVGKTEMEWDDSQDRIALVKECGFYCAPDVFSPKECRECSAQEFCDKYAECTEEWSDNE